jgi:hypothetical protein
MDPPGAPGGYSSDGGNEPPSQVTGHDVTVISEDIAMPKDGHESDETNMQEIDCDAVADPSSNEDEVPPRPKKVPRKQSTLAAFGFKRLAVIFLNGTATTFEAKLGAPPKPPRLPFNPDLVCPGCHKQAFISTQGFAGHKNVCKAYRQLNLADHLGDVLRAGVVFDQLGGDATGELRHAFARSRDNHGVVASILVGNDSEHSIETVGVATETDNVEVETVEAGTEATEGDEEEPKPKDKPDGRKRNRGAAHRGRKGVHVFLPSLVD